MTITVDPPTARTGQPVPRWAVVCAHLVAWCTVPAALWRLALGLGASLGFSGEMLQMWEKDMPGWGTVYVIGLSVLTEALALLTLGLVRPWGETWPRWIPGLARKAVPPRLVLGLATLGVLGVSLFYGVCAALWFGPENMGDPDAPQGGWGLLMTAAYAPGLLWGPLLAAVTYSYYRRTAVRP